MMSTSWSEPIPTPKVFDAAGFPAQSHPVEADLFVRQTAVPGHDQPRLEEARVLLVGAGGLGSWCALSLARTGVRQFTLVDSDRFDRTNAPRQLLFGDDLGRFKASALARNILPHMTTKGTVTAYDADFLDIDLSNVTFDVALFLVDNNQTRLHGVHFARQQRIPAVFGMLSLDAMRWQCFLQGPAPSDACLWCALPNLDPASSSPCAAGVITSCLITAAHATFFTHRALMGWPRAIEPFNWREGDLFAEAPDRAGAVVRRHDCPACSNW